MKYRGDISPEEYAAMEDGYEQGIVVGRAERDREAAERVVDTKLTDDEWRAFQAIPDQGYSHRAWIDARIAERMEGR